MSTRYGNGAACAAIHEIAAYKIAHIAMLAST